MGFPLIAFDLKSLCLHQSSLLCQVAGSQPDQPVFHLWLQGCLILALFRGSDFNGGCPRVSCQKAGPNNPNIHLWFWWKRLTKWWPMCLTKVGPMVHLSMLWLSWQNWFTSQLSGISFFFMGKAMLFPCRFSLKSNVKPVDLSPRRIGREIHPCCQVRQNISTGPWGSDGEMGVSKNHQNPWLIHGWSIIFFPVEMAILVGNCHLPYSNGHLGALAY